MLNRRRSERRLAGIEHNDVARAVASADYLGDAMPEGYERWTCSRCTAGCNYEAMTLCKESPCPFDIEKPESNHGCFAFIRKSK